MRLLSCLLLALMPTLAPASPGFRTNTIYGPDDRREWHEVEDRSLLQLADASMALVPKENLSAIGKRHFRLSGPTLGEENDLCPEERFFSQPTPAFCSGVLIGEDLMLTAGHCIEDLRHCQETAFVFGFALKDETQDPSILPRTEVYECQAILAKDPFPKADFALIRLNRAVRNHRPVKLARERSKALIGSPLAVVGYPAGLPMKFVAGGQIRSQDALTFVSNLDTLAGNSGSPIFHQVGGELLGLLIDGDEDFVKNKARGCRVSKRCADHSCTGEEALKASVVQRYLP